MRILVLVLVVVFTAFIGVLTALDMVHHGVNWLNVLAILIVDPVRHRDRRGARAATPSVRRSGPRRAADW